MYVCMFVCTEHLNIMGGGGSEGIVVGVEDNRILMGRFSGRYKGPIVKKYSRLK